MNIPRSIIIQQKSLVVIDYFIPEEHISTQTNIFFGILCISVPQMSLSKSIIFFKENKSQKASVSLESLLDKWKSLSKVWQSWFYLAFDFYDFRVFLFGFTCSEVDSLMQIIRRNVQNMVSKPCTSADESFLQTPVNTEHILLSRREWYFHPCCINVGVSTAWVSIHVKMICLLERIFVLSLTVAIKRKAILPCSYRSMNFICQKDQNAVSSVCSKFQSEGLLAAWLKFWAYTYMVYPLNNISKLYGYAGCACSLSLFDEESLGLLQVWFIGYFVYGFHWKLCSQDT